MASDVPPQAASINRLLQNVAPSVVVAVDLGTYGSGFVFSVNGGPIRLHEDWPAHAPARHGGATYPKTRSAVLLKNGRGVAFGGAAMHKLLSLSPEELQTGAYALVDGRAYKLGIMYGAGATAGTVQPGANATEETHRNGQALAAAGGLPASMSPVAACAEFLTLLRKYVVNELMRQGIAPSSGMIRWCLTVPALWDNRAKAAMREVALRAGLITRLDSDQLLIILEPEAAALEVARPLIAAACGAHHDAALGDTAFVGDDARAAAEQGAACPISAGDVFMVVDAGGGTVDITVHEVVERAGGVPALREIHYVPGVGGCCGGEAVDAAFEQHVRELVGDALFSAWHDAQPADYHHLMEDFAQVKYIFGKYRRPGSAQELSPAGAEPSLFDSAHDNDDDDDDYAGAAAQQHVPRVPMPASLHMMLSDEDKAHLLLRYGTYEEVVLAATTLANLFQPAVSGLLQLVDQQLQAVENAYHGLLRCNKVLLVGGLASSPYVQLRVREALRGRVAQVIVPEHPAAAVLKGAALYGLRPELIRARASRLTYGVRLAVPYEDGMPAKFWHPTEQCFYSAAGFSPFVARGQLVGHQDSVTHTFQPVKHDQEVAVVELWGSDQEEVPFLHPDGGSAHKVAELEVVLPRLNNSSGAGSSASSGAGGLLRPGSAAAGAAAACRPIDVTLYFGRTEIQVTAKDRMADRDCSMRVKFAFN